MLWVPHISEHPAKRICGLTGAAEEACLLQRSFLKTVNCCTPAEKRNGVCEKGDQKREGPQGSGRQKSKPAELQWQQIYLEMPLLKVGVVFALVLKTEVEVERRTSNKNRSELILTLM